jgi:biopolymer transport protein ExbD
MSSSVPEINATPLIDVLLVLLIFLILMLPRSTHSTRLDFQGRGAVQPVPEVVQIDVDFDGRAYWNGALIPDEYRLEQWLAATAGRTPEPELRISPDRRAPYERVVQILAAAQRRHLKRLVLDPVPLD